MTLQVEPTDLLQLEIGGGDKKAKSENCILPILREDLFPNVTEE